MCIALMVDPQGDPDIIAAQAEMKATLERWIPDHPRRARAGWLSANRLHSGRPQAAGPSAGRLRSAATTKATSSGYFIESAINHYTLTDGKDLRLYEAAKKLADCWVANIGPGKKEWFDGHQEMEQALVRFGRFVNDMEGNGRGDAYIKLAKFLLDSPSGGQEYDQSHLPPGPAVRSRRPRRARDYFYSGMADIAAETGDATTRAPSFRSGTTWSTRSTTSPAASAAAKHRKASARTIRCATKPIASHAPAAASIFFQYKLNLAYHDAQYADLYEQTMYNALLGGVDLDGKNFCYTNPLGQYAAHAVARLPLLRRQHSAHAADDADVELRQRPQRALRQHVRRQPH